MKIYETKVKAYKLDQWLIDCYEQGGIPKFIVPQRIERIGTNESEVTQYLVLWGKEET